MEHKWKVWSKICYFGSKKQDFLEHNALFNSTILTFFFKKRKTRLVFFSQPEYDKYSVVFFWLLPLPKLKILDENCGDTFLWFWNTNKAFPKSLALFFLNIQKKETKFKILESCHNFTFWSQKLEKKERKSSHNSQKKAKFSKSTQMPT